MQLEIKDIISYLNEIGEYISFQGNENDTINGFSSLFNYKENSVTFISPERKYSEDFNNISKKIKLIITIENEVTYPTFINHIKVKDSRRAFFGVLDKFFNNSFDNEVVLMTSNPNEYNKFSRVSSQAIIGHNVKIGTGCVIEGGVIIGDDCEIHHNVIIRRNTKIGNRCTIFSGTIIGERGFNNTTDEFGVHHMLEHYGGVVIEDDVHIGDNCCIIQGMIDDTIIKKGTKINTMVHIAHNCVIGENTKITLPCHICGSVVVGEGCHIAATAIRNQVKIGSHAILGIGSVVVSDVPDGVTVIGIPAKIFERN